MPEAPAAASLLSVKFELAMSIGESLELDVMARRFMVPLLNAVQGASCQMWLRRADGEPDRLAYPQRSLTTWTQGAERASWLAETAKLPPGPRRDWSQAPGLIHAVPVGDEGWLFIEPGSQPIGAAVLDAIGVVLQRLARAVRACREHARARELISQKAAAEAALQEANARMAEVFSLSSNGFANFDASGQLTFCNPQVGHLLGFTVAPGMTMADIDVRLRAARPDARPWVDLAAALAPDARCHQRLEFPGPRPRVVDCTLRRAPDDARVVAFLRDVTRETEVDRMKSEFLNTAAHELRTPMVSVYGFTELLLTRDLPAERQRRVLETVHRQAESLVTMVNELLDLARIEARQHKDLHRTPHRLAPLVQSVVDGLMLHGDPRRARLALAHPEALLDVDEPKFRRALTNVLSNAFKYSPDGGEVVVETINADSVANAPAGSIGVRVTDHGIGMTPEQSARVFERFYRADTSGAIPGTGLGMSLVKEIVELHGGRVDIASKPGHGTVVTLWWPLQADPDRVQAEAADPLLKTAAWAPS
jgi:signal transduction histidine kinase